MLEPIVPNRMDIEAWRLSAEVATKLGGVKLGEFNWPWVVLSLIAALEKNNEQRAGIQAMLDGNYPCPRAYRNEGGQCPHGIWFYEACEMCNDEWLTKLLAGG